MELIQYSQDKFCAETAKKIIELENTAWPDASEEKIFPSAPNTYAASFVLTEKDIAVCHVGLRKSLLTHKGQTYTAYGLSEVVTHPLYQNRGLAYGLIREAAQFIIRQSPDISIFTCASQKISLYTKCGWTALKNSCFVGGTKEKPFRSDLLGLTTMIMFISPKSLLHKKDFENTDIVFELGENQLW